MSPRVRLALPLLLAATACGPVQAPYVIIQGTILPMVIVGPINFPGAVVDVVDAGGTLGVAQLAVPTWDASGRGVFKVALDASTLPPTQTAFRFTLHRPGTGAGTGPLYGAYLLLARPVAKGPDLGTLTVTMDASSSLACLGLDYRYNQHPEMPLSGISPDAMARSLGSNSLLVYNYVASFTAYLADGTGTPPLGSQDLALQASQALPTDLTTIR